MRRLIFLCCLASLCSTTAFAQFTILSSTPVDGAVGVPLTTTLSFTFSEPLDTAARFDDQDVCLGMIINEPSDSLLLDSVGFSEDLTVMNIYFQFTPNTDFVFCISNARSLSGDSLAQPYGMNFTTAADHGAYTVSGTVSYADGTPQYAVVVLSKTSVAGQEGEPQTQVGTLVMGADGQYTIDYVRDGVYWPIAAKDVDLNGQIDDYDLAGFYDAEGDDHTDSIVVNGANVEGINLELRAITAVETTAVETPAAQLPASVSLAQNYPNPFNPETVISFTLPRAMVASVKIYNVLGREIATLASGPQSLGTHSVGWNAAAQPAGIYFYRLEAGTQTLTQKMLLVK